MLINDQIGTEALLGQAAEEAMELGKALLKLQRILHGTNPTALTREEAERQIMEESADLANCLTELDRAGICTVDEATRRRKMKRWHDSLSEFN